LIDFCSDPKKKKDEHKKTACDPGSRTALNKRYNREYKKTAKQDDVPKFLFFVCSKKQTYLNADRHLQKSREMISVHKRTRSEPRVRGLLKPQYQLTIDSQLNKSIDSLKRSEKGDTPETADHGCAIEPLAQKK